MASSNSTTARVVTDEALLEQLTTALTAAQAELAELEPKRQQLTQRIDSLHHTIAVFKGETPAPTRRRRGTGTRRPRKSTPDAPAAS